MSVDPILVGYFAAYALVLATPGPNMLVIGALASLKGFGGILPIAIGLGVGGTAVGAAMYLAAGLIPAGPGWQMGERLASALLLLWLGLRIMRAAPMVVADESASASEQGAEFALGLCTAMSNPVTLAFFASQMTGPLSDQGFGLIGPLLLVTGLLATGKALVVASMFSHHALRKRTLRWFRPVRISIGIAFIGLAAMRLAQVAAARLSLP